MGESGGCVPRVIVLFLVCFLLSEAIEERHYGRRHMKVPSISVFERKFPSHGKSTRSVTTREKALRKSSFTIQFHNERVSTYRMGWNPLSDLTSEEYYALLKAIPESQQATPSAYKKDVSIAMQNLPSSIDWATKDGGKYVTTVKNQGSCGSCWAFSGASVIESMVAISTNASAIPLSVQQILSCSTSLQHIPSTYPNGMVSSANGCNGGMSYLAFEYLKKVGPHGLTCDTQLPYEMIIDPDDMNTDQCIPDTNALVALWDYSSHYNTYQNDEAALMQALQSGPVAVSIDASGDGFRHYADGIYDANDCSSDGTTVNHAVVVVGYGQNEQGQQFWIVRNSWGTMWGEKGYIRIVRGNPDFAASGPCNMFLYATQPRMLQSNPNNNQCHTQVDRPNGSLSTGAYYSLGWSQWLLLLGLSSSCIAGGVLYLIIGEKKINDIEKKDIWSYEDCIMRYKLPSKAMLLKRLQSRKKATQSV